MILTVLYPLVLCSSEEKILPEPWILYVAIVSIPFTGILILLTACVFKFRSRGAS